VSILSDAELVALRAFNEENLPDLCEVLEETSVSNGAGGFVKTWAVVATYPCRGGKAVARVQEVAGGAGTVEVVVWPLTLPASARVSLTQRVRHLGDGFSRLLEVSRVAGPHTYQVMLSVEGTEIPEEA
jgi:hypothetical protein